jgi:hypothetical protein
MNIDDGAHAFALYPLKIKNGPVQSVQTTALPEAVIAPKNGPEITATIVPHRRAIG